ncbi:MAG: AAA family ATPase [Bacteroidales bacterium]|nr:AAA family ATPase [Bacteroidales bacterium]
MAINQTQQVTEALVEAYGIATEKRHEFLTPEHLLAGFLKDKDFWEAYTKCGRSQELENELYDYLNDLGSVPEGLDLKIDFSEQLQELFETAGKTAASAMVDMVQLHHVIYSFFRLEDSYARYYMEKSLDCSVPEFLNSLIAISDSQSGAAEDRLSKYFTPVKPEPAIVGRKEEMDKAFRILCRKRKNNVLLVGGRGVGKTTIARGISHLMESGEVPARLKDDMLIELNVNALLSGTQYRGDLEGRVQEIMDAVIDEGGLTVYIDELRSLGGAGKMDDSSKDILSLLITYFKSGDVKFIISATPEDVKKLESNNAGVLGLFRQIDVEEPAAEETEAILESLRPGLEEHHGVTYEDGTASHAVRSSQRYMLDRCLPDKAIDLMDEAGAYAQAKGLGAVSTKTIDLALADICKSDVQASDEEIRDDLFCMEERLGQKIYGQNGAIKAVSEAILMSKAGLLDSGKTIGNFLFVGPTGVGKTELSKVLAQQLHVPLHRFDMSEYSEKHSVAKLIGSPAGYVGYDDGGILTDTIRRNPYCVLLLDEIEKAHEDIYNLLLQIMDYAVITDNRGRKADFRNVVLIMTSNAGARYAHKAGIGFDRKADAGSAMAKEVKNVFAPEFINRLTSVVVFNDMDEGMARMILEDKIRKLQERLDAKDITLDITEDAFEKLLKEGFTPEYGARELERVLNARVTPLLMRDILFGRKENFRAVITATDEGYALS